MRFRVPVLCTAFGLFIATAGAAANVSATDTITRTMPLEIAGSFWIDNPIGDIEIVGTEKPGLRVTVTRTIVAADRDALRDGQEQTLISFEGDRNVRLIRTIVPRVRTSEWDSRVSYIISVPRTVHVRVAAKLARNIHISNITGNVTVKSITGIITLDNVSGSSMIDTTNGKVIYHYTQKPMTNAEIRAVNADIDVSLPPDSNVNWIADTLRGDVLTNLPVRAVFEGTSFRGTINAPGGPTVTTQTLIGNVRLLGNGLDPQNVRSLRQVAISRMQDPHAHDSLLVMPSRRIQLPIAGGGFDAATSVGDVQVGEIRGPAHIRTGAGEIELGLVYGDCNVLSLGGPLDLGDIMGTLDARTGAGDVQVRSARVGGRIFTNGGMIRLLYTGGPTTLQSGGGDIVVSQAAGPIIADTKSGDITITTDPTQKTQKINAHTAQGNITLNLHPNFGADIDATVLTSNPLAKSIRSDFNLQIERERVGGKIRIHATGKVNGGGDRIELSAEDGDIHITSVSTNPVTVVPPLP